MFSLWSVGIFLYNKEVQERQEVQEMVELRHTRYKVVEVTKKGRPYKVFLCFAVRTGLGPVTSSVTGWHSNQLN